MTAAASLHSRLRGSRTLAGARWPEYAELLEGALGLGYRPVSLERWLADTSCGGERALILRHDVDQHPRSALEMLAIERALGVESTWYLRWRTAHPRVVDALRAAGGAVGLHYETLSRRVLEDGLGPADIDAALLTRCRAELGEEIDAFGARHGALRSICPHGDSRVPFVDNVRLVREAGVEGLGVRWDAREAMAGRGLRYWLTDRAAPRLRWKDGVDPHALLREGLSPILCVTHPNHWASGLSLWGDRVMGGALRLAGASHRVAPVASASDDPPRTDG